MKVADVLQRDFIDNRSEFELLLYVANELNQQGQVLDFRDVLVDFQTLTPFQALWFDRYVQEGVILSNRSEVVPALEKDRVDSFLTNLRKCEAFRGVDLVKDEGDHLLWSKAIMEKQAPELVNQVFSGEYIFQVLSWLAARQVVGILEGKVPNKPLVLRLDHMWSDTKSAFLDLLAAQESCPSLQQFFLLDLEGKEEYDIEWDLLCYNSRNNGTFRFYSLEEKRELLQEFDLHVGSVCTLATRRRLSASNPFGRIQSVSLVIIKAIYPTSIEVSNLPQLCFYTPDELLQDWMKVETEEGREFTKTLLQPNLNHIRTETIALRDIGFGPYFEQEEFLLNPLDATETVTRPFNHQNVTMTAPEMAFLLLKTWEVPFDAELYGQSYDLGVSPDFLELTR